MEIVKDVSTQMQYNPSDRHHQMKQQVKQEQHHQFLNTSGRSRHSITSPGGVAGVHLTQPALVYPDIERTKPCFGRKSSKAPRSSIPDIETESGYQITTSLQQFHLQTTLFKKIIEHRIRMLNNITGTTPLQTFIAKKYSTDA